MHANTLKRSRNRAWSGLLCYTGGGMGPTVSIVHSTEGKAKYF